MPGLFDDVGGWFAGEGGTEDPNLYRPQDIAQARNQLLVQLGGALMAPRAQRGELMAGALPAYRESLQSGFKERQVAEDYAQQQAYDQMIKTGDLSQFGIPASQAQMMKLFPRQMSQSIIEKIMAEQAQGQFGHGKAATAGLQAIWLRNTKTGQLTPGQLVDTGGIIVGGTHYPDIPPGYEVDYGAIAGQKAEGTAVGKATGDARFNLGMADYWRGEGQKDIDTILGDTNGIWQGTGVGGGAYALVPGTPGAQFRTRLASLKSKVLSQVLPAFSNLKPMSEADRAAVENSVANLDPDRLGPEQMADALQALKTQLETLYGALQAQVPGEGPPEGVSQAEWDAMTDDQKAAFK